MTIDITMPFYGDPALFHDAVRSVLEQSDQRWRLIVVDDRYPELGPGEWVRSLGDDRISYVRNEENLGVSGNFRRCVELAGSDFVTIMGCDDLLLPRYVERMHELVDAYPDVSYVQPGVRVVDGDGQPTRPLPDRVKAWYAPKISSTTELRGEPLATSLARGNWTYFPSICWRRTTLVDHGFDPELDVALDLDLQFRIVDDAGTVVADTEDTFVYRRHGGSVSAWSANDGSRFEEERAVLEAAAERARIRGWKRTARAAHRRVSSRLSALSRLPDAVRARDGAGARSLLRHALLR